jgi:hypothetical protein
VKIRRVLWRSRPEAVKQADREARSRAPDRRMIETPDGILAIKLEWMKQTGVSANMTLYGADGWNAGARSWFERDEWSPDEDKSLAQVISEWTGMPRVEAEAFVEDTVSRWRRSSAFEEDVKLSRWSMRLMVGLAVAAALALVGVAALVWLIVSALT